jgi:hypothetical protein
MCLIKHVSEHSALYIERIEVGTCKKTFIQRFLTNKTKISKLVWVRVAGNHVRQIWNKVF